MKSKYSARAGTNDMLQKTGFYKSTKDENENLRISYDVPEKTIVIC